ncbi:MAG TPA: hypothetical protein VJL29_03520 [Thermoguttaceae bacterium]|nr:hypothetical protein [Thermoguttaceae bacterium]
MSEMIQEFVDSRGVSMRVDRQQGILRGVKVLGLRSRNGRTYLAEALTGAVGLYEGAKVNVNHPKANPQAARDYQDRIGNLRNVSVREGEGLFADFHFNPKHVLAEQLLWDAEHSPENVGFSHNVLARTSRQGERTVVEAITRVQSVDLVADPATTQGLFESVAEEGDPVEESRESSPAETTETAVAESSGELQRVKEELLRTEVELKRLRASEAQARRCLLICKLLGESRLSETVGRSVPEGTLVSERFLETLLLAADEQEVRELIRDRVVLAESLVRNGVRHRPLSRDPSTLDGRRTMDAKTFVKAIT